MKRSILSLCLLLVLSSLSLASAERLIIGSGAEVSSLDPRVATDIPSFQIISMIMEPLVTFDTGLGLEPRLATEWELNEDATEITFTLREGVMFHHGREFTAEDVRYTFAWVLDEENTAPNRQLYADIEEIEVVDDYTVRFHLFTPNSFLLNNIARMPIVPADRGDDGFADNPVGTGPMQFVSLRRDDRTVLDAFEDYWGGRAILDGVDVRPIPENATRLFALEGGEIDIFQANVVPGEIARLEDDPNFVVQRTPGTGYTYMGFNLLSEPLDDVRVRQAINHAIPREAIVQRVLEGVGTPGISMLMPDMPWFDDSVMRFDYNRERAQELMAEAGITERISLRLYTSENPIRIQLAEILAFELGAIGIDLEVTIEEFGAFLSRIQTTNDYDLFILSWGGQLDPDRAMARQFTTEGSAAYTNFSNERVDELIAEGRTISPDSDESIEIYQEAQRIIVEESPYAFMFYTEEMGVHHPGVTGWTIHGYSSNAWQDIHLISLNR